MCVALALAAGMALARMGWMWAAGAAVGCLLGGLLGVARAHSRAGLGLIACAMVVGGSLLVASQRAAKSDVSRLPEGGQTIVGTVADAPLQRGDRWSFVLEAERHEDGSGTNRVSGRVFVRGPSATPVRRGERWRVTGRLRSARGARNPGERSEASRLASLGVSSVLTVGSEQLAERVGRGHLGGLAGHASRAQTRALEVLERAIPGPYRGETAAVAASVIFGVHATPPPREVTEAFRRAGTIHLLVVSGAIVSMVFGLVFLPGALGASWRRARSERELGWESPLRGRVSVRPGAVAALLGMVVVVYYAVLTEGGQAVARAAVMGVLAGLALALRRMPRVAREHGVNVDHYTLLAAAAIAVLAVTPSALFQPGFQLSFAAVAAILYLTPKAMPHLERLPKWLGYAVAGTLAAQLATFPILAYHYGNAPIAGLGANLLAVPLAGVVLVGGMSACALGVCLPVAAPVAGWVTGVATRAMVWISATFAALPWASPEVPRPGVVAIAAWYGGLLVVGRVLGRKRPNHR